MKSLFRTGGLLVIPLLSGLQLPLAQAGHSRFDSNRGEVERYVLDLNGQEFNSGQGEDTIPLKALIMQKYGNVNLHDEDLARVAFLAKSRFGRGQVRLLVGNELSQPQTIDGNPRDYDSRGGYFRYEFFHPGADSRGVWQLKLQGNIKVGKIKIITKEKGPGHGRTQTVHLGPNSCSGGWCSCVTPGILNRPHAPSAERLCRELGFRGLFGQEFSTEYGPRGQLQCASIRGGAGCYINKNPGNIVCTAITCER